MICVSSLRQVWFSHRRRREKNVEKQVAAPDSHGQPQAKSENPSASPTPSTSAPHHSMHDNAGYDSHPDGHAHDHDPILEANHFREPMHGSPSSSHLPAQLLPATTGNGAAWAHNQPMERSYPLSSGGLFGYSRLSALMLALVDTCSHTALSFAVGAQNSWCTCSIIAAPAGIL